MPEATTLISLLGFLAGTLTTLAFVPQVIQTYRSRSTRDISLGMFLLFSLGLLLWLIYGVLTSALPVILANGVTLLLALGILWMKLRFR